MFKHLYPDKLAERPAEGFVFDRKKEVIIIRRIGKVCRIMIQTGFKTFKNRFISCAIA